MVDRATGLPLEDRGLLGPRSRTERGVERAQRQRERERD